MNMSLRAKLATVVAASALIGAGLVVPTQSAEASCLYYPRKTSTTVSVSKTDDGGGCKAGSVQARITRLISSAPYYYYGPQHNSYSSVTSTNGHMAGAHYRYQPSTDGGWTQYIVI